MVTCMSHDQDMLYTVDGRLNAVCHQMMVVFRSV